MAEHIHKTRDGVEIPVSKMENGHLAHTIRFFAKRAREGVKVVGGCGVPSDVDSMDYWEDVYRGAAAERVLNLSAYIEEARRRGWSEEEIQRLRQ